MSKKNTMLLRLIFGLSLIASLGSLYYGYFGDIVINLQTGDLRNTANALAPCNLCRYIRVFTYPVVIITFIGLFLKDQNVKYYIIRISTICLLFCMYKYGLELHWINSKTDSFICTTSSIDCTEAKPNYFGFISLALLGIIANAIQIILSLMIKSKNN